MKQPLIVILILLVIGLGFGYVFVWPNYQRWNGKKGELKSITTALEDLAAKKSFIKQLEDAEPTLSQMSEQALMLIPVAEERDTFSSELDALAQANGLSLTTLSFAAAPTTKKKMTTANEDGSAPANAPPAASTATGAGKSSNKGLDYTAAITGKYASIEKFLKQLDQTKRYTSVAKFELSTSADTAAGTTEPTITLNFSGTILTKPLNKKFAKDQKFSTDIWKFLIDRTTTVPTAATTNPFVAR